MKKLFLIGILFLFLLTGIVFGHESNNNSVAGGINFSILHDYISLPNSLGLGIEYERLLGNKFSVGIDIRTFGPGYLPFAMALNAEIFGRFYPFSGGFFTGLSFGVWGILWAGGYTGEESFGSHFEGFPKISPELGWKIDFGKINRLFILPSVKMSCIYIIQNNTIRLGSSDFSLKIGYRF